MQNIWTPPERKQWMPGEHDSPRAPALVSFEFPNSYPPLNDLSANIRWRKRIWDSLHRPAVANRIRAICRKDPIFWMAGFSWIYETRASGSEASGGLGTTLPFIPYDYEIETINKVIGNIRGQRDLAIPKSRDMGATWTILLTFQWMWTYWNGFTALLLSKTEKLVDKLGDPNTLMEKIRFNILRQPQQLKPQGYDHKEHSKYLLLINPENGSSISGAATTGDAGRSGRFNVILKDEHAAIEANQAIELETSTADASPCRIYLSTPKGNRNIFFKKCHGATDRHDIHWWRHPYKGYAAWQEISFKKGKLVKGKIRSPWYDYEVEISRKDQPPWVIAQELDIDFSGSGETMFSSETLRFWREENHIPIETGLHRHRTDGEPALNIFEKPIPECEYLICLDPNGGSVTGSRVGIHVFKLPNFDQVLEYQGNPGIEIMSSLLYVFGREYNWAFVGIENNIGRAIIADMLKGHLDREGIGGEAGIFLEPYPEDRIAKNRNPKEVYNEKEIESAEYGIRTSGTTKPYMVWTLGEPTIRQQDCRIRGSRTIDELSGFRQDSQQLRNPDGDDLVMSFLIGLYAYCICWRPGSSVMLPIMFK